MTVQMNQNFPVLYVLVKTSIVKHLALPQEEIHYLFTLFVLIPDVIKPGQSFINLFRRLANEFFYQLRMPSDKLTGTHSPESVRSDSLMTTGCEVGECGLIY